MVGVHSSVGGQQALAQVTRCIQEPPSILAQVTSAVFGILVTECPGNCEEADKTSTLAARRGFVGRQQPTCARVSPQVVCQAAQGTRCGFASDVAVEHRAKKVGQGKGMGFKRTTVRERLCVKCAVRSVVVCAVFSVFVCAVCAVYT